jgi:hypothetical protein
MDVQPGPVRRSHRAEPLTPSSSPLILPAEALVVALLIFVLALGLMIRSTA